MNYLILVSHGGLAEGLRTSLEMFAEDAMAEVIALGLKNGSSVDEFAEEFRMFASDCVLLLRLRILLSA